MSALRTILESPPKNADKREMSPQNKRKAREEQQWHTAGWRTPPNTFRPVAKKVKKIVPEQLQFTEQDSLASLRAQVEGLRTDNSNLRVLNATLLEDNGMAIHNYAVLERHYKAMDTRHKEIHAADKTTENILLANCRQYEREKVANDDRWAAKESEVKRLQREFNDAVNSLLAEQV
jgi:hypothetical protein